MLECPSENQNPTDSGRRPVRRRGPVGEQLAGGVVDRGDVVDVEGVPQPERVREHAHPGAEDRGRPAELVVLGDDEAEQHAEADGVQRHDDGAHADQRAAVGPVEPPHHRLQPVTGTALAVGAEVWAGAVISLLALATLSQERR